MIMKTVRDIEILNFFRNMMF